MIYLSTLTRLAVTRPPSMTGGPSFSESSKLTFFICFDDNLFFLLAAKLRAASDRKATDVDSCFKLLRMYEFHAPIESLDGLLEFRGEGSKK